MCQSTSESERHGASARCLAAGHTPIVVREGRVHKVRRVVAAVAMWSKIFRAYLAAARVDGAVGGRAVAVAAMVDGAAAVSRLQAALKPSVTVLIYRSISLIF